MKLSEMSIFGEYATKNLTQIVLVLESKGLEGDVTEDDMQRRHCNVGTMLEPFKTMSRQYCNAVLR